MTATGVVVLHYRNWPAVAECVESVLAEGVAPEAVRIVDNASGDGSVDEIRRAFPSVVVLELPENGGYAAGMNAGIAQFPDVEHVLLVTNDCVLVEGALHALLRAIEVDGRIGIVGPLLALRSDPTRVFSAGGTLYGPRLATGHTGAGEPVEQWFGAPPHDAAYVDGACLLARTRALRALGGFDEGYFMYFEEADLARRAVRAGWRVVCTRDALALQEPGPRPEALWTRNRLRFLRRNAGRFVAARECAVDVAGIVRRLLSTDPDARDLAFQRLQGVVAPLTRTSPEHLARRGSS
jgi:GT2 family glycosyltransferase